MMNYSILTLDPGTGSRLYNQLVSHQNGRNGFLRIGELAQASGVSADTLRHYERKGLLKPRRSASGYREYPAQALDRVRMIRSALALGFRLDDLTRIFKVRDAGGAPCRQVRELAAVKLDEVESLLQELTAVRNELRKLLKDWDQRLDSMPAEEPARLLEMLAASGLARGQTLSLLKPNFPNRKPKKEAK
jgi:MerR family transcriptional regulator, copper efflux regulator